MRCDGDMVCGKERGWVWTEHGVGQGRGQAGQGGKNRGRQGAEAEAADGSGGRARKGSDRADGKGSDLCVGGLEVGLIELLKRHGLGHGDVLGSGRGSGLVVVLL